MKRVGNLFSEVIAIENLLSAFRKALKGKKYKHTVSRFYFDMERELVTLQRELAEGDYRPGKYRTFKIYEPKQRVISATDFRDRVVHHAICNVLDPIFERRFIFDTYACRKDKGVHIAIHRAQQFVNRNAYYLKCDIKKYFESIDREILKGLLKRILKDKDLLKLIFIIIDKAPEHNGLPIGNLTSQYFANLYLGELDLFLIHKKEVSNYIRYMDDFILFANGKEELHQLLIEIRLYLSENLKLKLKEKVVRVSPVTEGLPFLGHRIYKNLIRLQRSNLVRFRKKIRKKEGSFNIGEISENDLVNSVRSVLAHVSHVNTHKMRGKHFSNQLG